VAVHQPPSARAERPPPYTGSGDPGEESGTLEWLAGLLRRHRLVVLGMTLLGLGAAVLLSQQDDKYEARASLLFAPPASAGIVGETRVGGNDPQRSGTTRAELLRLDQQARRAARALGLSSKRVSDAVRIEAPSDADVVTVVATTRDARLSARIAEVYAREFISFRRRVAQSQIREAVSALERQLAAIPFGTQLSFRRLLRDRIATLRAALPLQTGDTELVQRAAVPTAAQQADLGRNLVIGGLGGLLLGLAIASGLQRADRRVRTSIELEAVYDAPVLAEIPRSRALRRHRKRMSAFDEHPLTQGEELEAFRTLRAGLRTVAGSDALQVLLVVSPAPGEGKSTVAHGLALTMAAMGDQVVLVDADLRKDDRAQDRHEGRRGLVGALEGGDIDDELVEHAVGKDPVQGSSRVLWTLPSGPVPRAPAELLESAQMNRVLTELEDRFDTLVIDTSALGRFSDALALIPRATGVVIVGAKGKTQREPARNMHRELGFADARVLGVVANLSRRTRRSGSYYD
jgi:capsular exopolysaccharide synthesis family protein